jgi:hypothetical protein
MEKHDITKGKEARKRGAISRAGEAIYGSNGSAANAVDQDDFLFEDDEMAVPAGTSAEAEGE